MSVNTVETDFYVLEKLFLALGDKTRLRLLALVADGEAPVGFLADKLGESQPKVSRHLAYLRGAGIVQTRRDGKWIYYAISYPQGTLEKQVLDRVVRSIATVRVDQERVYLAEGQTPREDHANGEQDIYLNGDVDEPADVYEEEDEYIPQSEEMEVFLL